ncbi:MAG TPA: outer membrane beta-barrel protein [Steroidobacteraceae bacterium]|jgi:OOP family OmpA-OmpF porin|nr:outer membrane beta-barrel protein [Steroidobacteraceae bacterium]
MILAKTSAATFLLALALAVAPARAQNPGWYVGGNGGLSLAKIDDQRIAADLLSGGFATTSIDNNQRDGGFKLFGGYQFGRYFALEGGYFNLGKFGFTANTLPPGTLTGTIRLQGMNFDAVAMLPVTDAFFAFGRIGANYGWASDRFAGTGAVNVLDPSASKSATNYKFGFGLEYDFTEHFGTRLEAERYRIADGVGNRGEIDMVSLGVLYRFGAPAAHAPVAMAIVVAPPEWVAGERTAELQAVTQPVLAPRPDIVLVFEQLHFQFDRSTLTDESRAILKRSIRVLQSHPATTVRLAGYASAAGSAEYNRKLSERRAKAVEAYLIGQGSIAPDRLAIIGYGDSRPEQYEAVPSDVESDAAHANMRVRFEVIVD